MSTASLALPFAPLLDERSIEVLRRRAVQVGCGLAYTASSLAFAVFLWLLLAGPGFATDHASTLATRGGRVIVQK